MGGFDGDTDLGGRKRDFPSTCWSRFLNRPSGGGWGDPQAAEALARSYWKPVYAYIRSRWKKSNEEAKDLTQEFFLHMIESDLLSKADPARGRFRTYVRLALEHYLVDEARRRKSLKRGGEREIFTIEAARTADAGIENLTASGKSPDQVLDATWKSELFARATELLNEGLRGEGKETCVNVFRDYYFSATGELNYREVAAKYGISENDVSNFLMHAKRKFRSILTDLVAETVRGESELQDELNALFGGLP